MIFLCLLWFQKQLSARNKTTRDSLCFVSMRTRSIPTFTHFTLIPGHTNFFISNKALQSPHVMGQPISTSSLFVCSDRFERQTQHCTVDVKRGNTIKIQRFFWQRLTWMRFNGHDGCICFSRFIPEEKTVLFGNKTSSCPSIVQLKPSKVDYPPCGHDFPPVLKRPELGYTRLYIPSDDWLELEYDLSLIWVIGVTFAVGLHHHHIPHGHSDVLGGCHHTQSWQQRGATSV